MFPWTELVTAWAVFAANVLSPGPNVFNTVAIALGSGRQTALAVVPAIGIGVTLWASAAVFGAAAAFRAAPQLQDGLTALGGVLLLWLASRYARRAVDWSDPLGRSRLITPRQAFTTTLGILATNPKALTTWLVLISIFPAGTAGPQARATMIAGAVVVACAGHLVYALAFSTEAAARAYGRAGRWIDAAVALFFATLGLRLLFGVAGHLSGS